MSQQRLKWNEGKISNHLYWRERNPQIEWKWRNWPNLSIETFPQPLANTDLKTGCIWFPWIASQVLFSILVMHNQLSVFAQLSFARTPLSGKIFSTLCTQTFFFFCCFHYLFALFYYFFPLQRISLWMCHWEMANKWFSDDHKSLEIWTALVHIVLWPTKRTELKQRIHKKKKEGNLFIRENLKDNKRSHSNLFINTLQKLLCFYGRHFHRNLNNSWLARILNW